jgi:hypothetical protein
MSDMTAAIDTPLFYPNGYQVTALTNVTDKHKNKWIIGDGNDWSDIVSTSVRCIVLRYIAVEMQLCLKVNIFHLMDFSDW